MLPLVPKSLPIRHYGWLGTAGRLWLQVSGWRVEGQFPEEPRVVVALAPHSSNWDFVQVVAAVFALRLRVCFIGKHTLFRWPLGGFMRWMGGIPVDRSRADGLVDATTDAMRSADAMWIGITPEGTRSRGAHFRSGFYRIAQAAGVPVLPISINHQARVIAVHAPVCATRPVDEGVEHVRALLLSQGARHDHRKQAD
jgi:1-acyl-sn-glycerol-3-phosphate acyltransferase